MLLDLLRLFYGLLTYTLSLTDALTYALEKNIYSAVDWSVL